MAEKKIRVGRFSWLRHCDQLTEFDEDVDSDVLFFDMADLPEIESQPDDIDYTVQARDWIDMLAATFYGDSLLWWVIAARNDLELPETELYRGRRIVIPSPRYVREVLIK